MRGCDADRAAEPEPDRLEALGGDERVGVRDAQVGGREPVEVAAVVGDRALARQRAVERGDGEVVEVDLHGCMVASRSDRVIRNRRHAGTSPARRQWLFLEIVRDEELVEHQASNHELTAKSAIIALRRRNIIRQDHTLAFVAIAVAVALLTALLPELFNRSWQVKV